MTAKAAIRMCYPMIDLAYCDDDEMQLELLSDTLHDLIEEAGLPLNIIGFSSGKELLQSVRSGHRYDIFILDMIMPEMNGLETAASLRQLEEKGKIIFLTSSLDYAIQSYNVQAFYYMLKPIDRARLKRVLQNAVSDISDVQDSISIRGRNGNYVIRLRDLMYVDVESRGLRYHTRDGRTICCPALRGSFRSAVSDIGNDSRFFFCGVSYLLNLHYIDSLDTDSVHLSDGTVLYPPKAAFLELKRHWRDSRF